MTDRTIPSGRMAILFCVMLVAAAGNTAMQSLLPAIGTRIGIPDVWVSLAFSWSALLWVITAPRWARLSDRRGRRNLMALGMAGFILSMALCGLTIWAGMAGWLGAAATFGIFALFRSLYGAFGSAAPPAVQAYVAARTPPAQRTQALALLASSFGLGTVIGPAVAPLFILPVIGLAAPMLAFALIGLVVLALLFWGLPNDTPRFAARGDVADYPAAGGSGRDSAVSSAQDDDGQAEPYGIRVPLAWRDARSSPWLVAGLIGGQAQAMMLGVVGFLVLDRLILRATPEAAAGPTAIVLMAGAFASLLAQWGLIPILKPSPRMAVLLGAGLGGLGAVMTGLADGLHGITLGFAVASLGFGLFRPGFTAGASLAVGRHEQGAVAGMTASINGSAYIVSPAVGVLVYGWSALTAFVMMAGFCVCLLVWGSHHLRDPAS